MTDRYLTIYLRDHLAMGRAGIDFARRVATENRKNELGPGFERIVDEIDEEASVLAQALELLEVEPSQLKLAGAWLVEKLGRLKLNGEIRGYSPLSRLLEIEFLIGAVQMRKGLWMTLLDAKHMYPVLDQLPIERLYRRVDRQLDDLYEMHVKAGRNMLKAGWDRDEGQRRPPAR